MGFHGFRKREGSTGTFPGHAIPAACFLTVGCMFLFLGLKRARNLQAGESFAQQHIPEKNTKLLRNMGLLLMPFTFVGMIVEATGGYWMYHNIFFQLAHETIYFSYFCVGLSSYLESQRRLPPDTFRIVLVMALVGEYLIWNSHGKMKQVPTDQILHILLSYLVLASAAITAFSIRYTDSVIAYVGCWSSLILQAMWLLTAGVYEAYVDMPMHDIATFLAIESMILTIVVALVYAFFGPAPLEQDSPEFRRQFSPLNSQDDDTEEGMKLETF